MASACDAFPVTVISPACQSMSASTSPAASAPRSPSRASSIKIARSRSPDRDSGSGAAMMASTWAGSRPRGSALSRQPATAGTAPASGTVIRPLTCRNRSSDRVAVTSVLADQVLAACRACRMMNEVTAAASSCRRLSSSGSPSSSTSLRPWTR